MKKLIAAVVLAGVAPLALADADPYFLMPEVGGAEATQYVAEVTIDKTGINSQALDESFWYAGTSGVSSN